MKRTYLILLIVVACAAVLGMFIVEHTGYVLISWKSFRYESSLWMFLALLTAVLALLYGLRTLIKMTSPPDWSIPGRVATKVAVYVSLPNKGF